MKTLILLLPLILTSCSFSGGLGRADDGGQSGDRQSRGFSTMQFGLVNVNSGNSVTQPERRDDTRIRLDQTTRFQLDNRQFDNRQR